VECSPDTWKYSWEILEVANDGQGQTRIVVATVATIQGRT
jgi:hypothetical protein